MLLAIETSCDETSAAVVNCGQILSITTASQVELHAEYGGVVPELATREHLRNLQPTVLSALSKAGISTHDLNGIAATCGPGLPPALMIGWKAAQSAAFALKVPLIGINHIEGHLYSPWIKSGKNFANFTAFQPNVSLIVSGGHTQLVLVHGLLNHSVIGCTLDDAAGECFDKIAKLLDLAYPGGPQIDKLAKSGNPSAFKFPRPMLDRPNYDFSFSGLKTSVRYLLEKNPELKTNNAILPDLCASTQAAIVDVLIGKTMRAAEETGVSCITASGGVCCNSALRDGLALACDAQNIQLQLAAKELCTDNAAMIGILAEKKIENGCEAAPYDTDIKPSWALT